MTKIRGWRYFSLVMAVMLALGVGAIVVTPSHASMVPQCIQTSTGTGAACFTVSAYNLEQLTPLTESSLNCPPPFGLLDFPHGFFSFHIVRNLTTDPIEVTITLPLAMPVGTEYWKCINGEWVDCTSLLSSDDGDNVLVLTLTDGGLGDRDGEVNGEIDDPGGPAVRRASTGHGVSWRPPPRALNPSLMSLQYLSINPQQTSAGQPVTITTNVVNTGDEAGNLNVTLNINGQLEQSRTVSVGPQGTQPVKFTVTKDQPGTYDVNILDKSGSFIITGSGGTAGASTSSGLIAVMFVVVVALIIVTVVLLLRRRTA